MAGPPQAAHFKNYRRPSANTEYSPAYQDKVYRESTAEGSLYSNLIDVVRFCIGRAVLCFAYSRGRRDGGQPLIFWT